MGWFSFGSANQNANGKKSEGKIPGAVSRRFFLKSAGATAALAMVPDAVQQLATSSNGMTAAEYAKHLEKFVQFGDDMGLQTQAMEGINKRVAAALKSGGQDEARLVQLIQQEMGGFERYTNTSMQKLLDFHQHTQHLSVAQQKALLQSPEVQQMIGRNISHTKLGPFSSEALTKRQVSNTISRYNQLLDQGPLVNGSHIQLEHADHIVSSVEAEVRRHSTVAADIIKKQRRKESLQKDAEQKLGKTGPDLIASVKPRVGKDGYILRLNPLLKEYSRNEQLSQVDALIQRIETQAYAGEQGKHANAQPHVLRAGMARGFLVVKCAPDSNASAFFAQLAELKPEQTQARTA